MIRRTGTRDVATVRRQLMLSTGLLSVLVAVALVVIVQFAVGGAADDSVRRVLGDRADALIASTDVASTEDRLLVPSGVMDPGVAVFDAAGRRVAGAVPPDLAGEFDQWSTAGRTHFAVVHDETYAVYARPFTTPDGLRGVVVLAERMQPYEGDENDALWVSAVAGALMVLLALGVAEWISRRVLAPVREMADTAGQWSEHDLERRFDLGEPTDELRALGHTLDGLLAKVARAIRAEQRLTSELAHELRSPLTAIAGTAELMAMRPDLDEQLREDVEDIRATCREMSATVTVLLDLARRSSSETGETTTGTELVAALEARFPEAAGLRIDLDDRLVLSDRPPIVLGAIAPVVENALRVSEHVAVSSRPAGEHVELLVVDDGPGVAANVADRIFEPGVSQGGSGLGLPLARRIARSAGGDVLHVPAAGGATFVVRLPGRVG
jgi:two-component system OmpR family sensor kinase